MYARGGAGPRGLRRGLRERGRGRGEVAYLG